MTSHHNRKTSVNGKAVLSLILGVASIVSAFFLTVTIISSFIGAIGFIIGITVLRDRIHLHKVDFRLALWGIILSCIGLFMPVILFIAFLFWVFIGRI